MVTDEQRGRYGRWLRRERLARGWSTDETRERLARRGYRIGESSYAEWESGRKRPSRDALPWLVEMFGEPDPEPVEAAAPAVDLSALISATAAFTRAVDEQTQKLDRVWERMGDLIERLDRQPEALTRDDAQAMAEGLADGIGASLAGAIGDLAAALRQPAPAGRGGRG